MWIMYLIPVIAIAGVLIYTFVARARINQAVAEGKGPLLFHEGFAGYFPSLNQEEYLIGVWQGLAYTGSQSSASQVAGAILNEVSSKAIGFSKYTPMVFVGVTSAGRVLVAQEYSEMGDRGNYKEVHVWVPGASAVTGPAAMPDHSGPAAEEPVQSGRAARARHAHRTRRQQICRLALTAKSRSDRPGAVDRECAADRGGSSSRGLESGASGCERAARRRHPTRVNERHATR